MLFAIGLYLLLVLSFIELHHCLRILIRFGWIASQEQRSILEQVLLFVWRSQAREHSIGCLLIDWFKIFVVIAVFFRKPFTSINWYCFECPFGNWTRGYWSWFHCHEGIRWIIAVTAIPIVLVYWIRMRWNRSFDISQLGGRKGALKLFF